MTHAAVSSSGRDVAFDGTSGVAVLSRVTKEGLHIWEATERQLVAELPGLGERVLATAMVAIGGRPAVVLTTPYQVAAMILPET